MQRERRRSFIRYARYSTPRDVWCEAFRRRQSRPWTKARPLCSPCAAMRDSFTVSAMQTIRAVASPMSGSRRAVAAFRFYSGGIRTKRNRCHLLPSGFPTRSSFSSMRKAPSLRKHPSATRSTQARSRSWSALRRCRSFRLRRMGPASLPRRGKSSTSMASAPAARMRTGW